LLILACRSRPLLAVFLLIAAFLGACTSQQDLSDSQPADSTADPGAVSTSGAPAAVELATAVPDTRLAETPTSEPPPPGTAGAPSQANADVLFVAARQESENSWQFTVTVEHPDTGWDDYADGWDVVLPDGTVVKPDPESPFTRLLLHPHENEQPFTRSQSGVIVEPEINEVTVRAHDLVDGFGGRTVTVDLLREKGPDYEVQR
jgi:hypothetical protein